MWAIVSVLQKRRAENESKITELRTNKANTEGEVLKIQKSLHLEEGDTDADKKLKEQLKLQLKSLKDDPFYREKLAREEYGLSKPDEYIFQYDR